MAQGEALGPDDDVSAPSPTSEEAGPQPRSPGWSRVAERGSLWGLRFTYWCYRMLGRRLTLPLIYAIVTYFFVTDAPGRRASLAYLRRVHADPVGRRSIPTAPGLRHCFRHYSAFGLAIVDRVGIWFGRGDEFEFESHGLEHIDRLASEGRGALVLGSHLGSFDALRLLADRSKTVVNVLMYTANARLINSIFRELSPNAEARVIVADPHSVQSVFTIRERLSRGEHVAILADRIEIGDRDRAVRVPLLGGDVDLPQAPVLLANLLGCPILLLVALRSGPGRYRVDAELLADRVRLPRRDRAAATSALLTTYAQRLEHYVVRNPYQWFNFFDYWGDAGADAESAPAKRPERNESP